MSVMTMTLNDFLQMQVIRKLLREITPISNKFAVANFSPFVCMLIEEWCLENNCDAVQLAQAIADTVRELNKEQGKYERN